MGLPFTTIGLRPDTLKSESGPLGTRRMACWSSAYGSSRDANDRVRATSPPKGGRRLNAAALLAGALSATAPRCFLRRRVSSEAHAPETPRSEHVREITGLSTIERSGCESPDRYRTDAWSRLARPSSARYSSAHRS